MTKAHTSYIYIHVCIHNYVHVYIGSSNVCQWITTCSYTLVLYVMNLYGNDKPISNRHRNRPNVTFSNSSVSFILSGDISHLSLLHGKRSPSHCDTSHFFFVTSTVFISPSQLRGFKIPGLWEHPPHAIVIGCPDYSAPEQGRILYIQYPSLDSMR